MNLKFVDNFDFDIDKFYEVIKLVFGMKLSRVEVCVPHNIRLNPYLKITLTKLQNALAMSFDSTSGSNRVTFSQSELYDKKAVCDKITTILELYNSAWVM